MIQQKESKGVQNAPSDVITCKHCKEVVYITKIIGLSLVCPSCNKPQNGRLNLSPADFQ